MGTPGRFWCCLVGRCAVGESLDVESLSPPLAGARRRQVSGVPIVGPAAFSALLLDAGSGRRPRQSSTHQQNLTHRRKESHDYS
jgi:hypothetical protein